MRALSLFGLAFLLQLGHLIEHLSKALQGRALLGSDFDSEASHLVFNAAIALLALVLVQAYSKNPWVYPLAFLALLHGIEHVYIFDQFLRTGLTEGPGLLGSGGALGIVPIARLELHNLYNGGEVVLMTLGISSELDEYLK